MALVLFFGMVLIAACSGNGGAGEAQEPAAAAEPHDEQAEHAGEGEGEHGHSHEGEEGEESGTELTLDETYDQVRNGAHLILAYDADTNSFKGTVENTTQETLYHVRVEVHLSEGTELGPVDVGDLASGEKRDVEVKATSTDFEGWTAHPEAVVGEHEHD
jgi:hypothetical protein